MQRQGNILCNRSEKKSKMEAKRKGKQMEVGLQPCR